MTSCPGYLREFIALIVDSIFVSVGVCISTWFSWSVITGWISNSRCFGNLGLVEVNKFLTFIYAVASCFINIICPNILVILIIKI